MKKFTLSADFIKWNSTDENSTEADSFGYVIDLESEEEARIRLDSLIIERMSSKPGWTYKLLTSSLAEFPISDEEDSVKIIYDIPVLSSQTDPLTPDEGGKLDLPASIILSDSEGLNDQIITDQPEI